MSGIVRAPGPIEWLTPQQVSELTGITVANLAKLRSARKHLPFHKPTGPNGRAVLYDRDEVDAYIRSTRVKVRAY